VRVEGVVPILNVSDIEASIEWFTSLGWQVGFTWPNDTEQATFGSVRSDGAQIFLCRNAQGSQGTRKPTDPRDEKTDGVWMSWWLGSPTAVVEAHALALQLGYEVSRPPTDELWGVREFHLRHPDGHTFRVGAGLGEG
jgi:catechol 2,3-dioxygenase-like lactoylglutathione lyase family enzyme